jgi:protein O-GlcNAc transferase
MRPRRHQERERNVGVAPLGLQSADGEITTCGCCTTVNPYWGWGEIEHYHNVSRKRLYALLEEQGFRPAEYHVSERHRLCMDVVSIKQG